MIPTGDDWRIKKALTYMSPEKVLQWAQVTICPTINQRDIDRLRRDMPKPRPRTDKEGDHRFHQHVPTVHPRDCGTLGKKIDAYIAARSKECGVHPDFYRRALGW